MLLKEQPHVCATAYQGGIFSLESCEKKKPMEVQATIIFCLHQQK